MIQRAIGEILVPVMLSHETPNGHGRIEYHTVSVRESSSGLSMAYALLSSGLNQNPDPVME